MDLRRVNHKNGFRCGLMLTLRPKQGRYKMIARWRDAQDDEDGDQQGKAKVKRRRMEEDEVTKESKFISWDIFAFII